ncbi:hypothetical protein V8B97DRAFT_1860601, partial [Scleroderma yunnanense]
CRSSYRLATFPSESHIRPDRGARYKRAVPYFRGFRVLTRLQSAVAYGWVIILMATLVLANGDQVVRVVVPKAITIQMFPVVDRLGGLTNRRIIFV